MCVLDFVGLFCSHWIQLLYTCREVTIMQKAGYGPVNEANYSVFVDSCCNNLHLLAQLFCLYPQIFSCAWLLLQSPTSCSTVCRYVELHILELTNIMYFVTMRTRVGCVHFSTTAHLCTHNNWGSSGFCSVDILPIIANLSHTCPDGLVTLILSHT